jgi:hypothetical protein
MGYLILSLLLFGLGLRIIHFRKLGLHKWRRWIQYDVIYFPEKIAKNIGLIIAGIGAMFTIHAIVVLLFGGRMASPYSL